jgi:hypothetical protein
MIEHDPENWTPVSGKDRAQSEGYRSNSTRATTRKHPSQLGLARRHVSVAVFNEWLKRCGPSVLSWRHSPFTLTNRT